MKGNPLRPATDIEAPRPRQNGNGDGVQIEINPATHQDRVTIAGLYDELANLARVLAEKERRCIILERELLRLKAEAEAPAKAEAPAEAA